MKIKYGLYEDTFYAPIWFLGLMHDVTHDGRYIWALVFGKWYIGIVSSAPPAPMHRLD